MVSGKRDAVPKMTYQSTLTTLPRGWVWTLACATCSANPGAT